MSRTTDLLALTGCRNAGNFAEHGQVYIDYRAADSGRGGPGAAWQVFRPGYRTEDDPNAYYLDYGRKTFRVNGRSEQKAKLEEAQKWAKSRYGITKWKKTPFGSYMDADYVDSRLEALMEMAKRRAEGNASDDT